MFVQMGTTLSRFTGITLGCVVYQKTSGLPIVGAIEANCRRQLKLITSVKVGHSRTSVYFTSKYGLAEPIQRRHYVTTLYDINQETTR
jgi:hypothetical protein